MAKSPRLKVFRTATGFDDAYVAAPSRKAALEAWGASKDLFAIGAAELVTDPAIAEEILAKPGQVIRRSRGGLAEQIAALPRSRAKAAPSASGKPAPKPPTRNRSATARPSKPRPRPARDALDAAEAALRTFEADAEAELARLREREAALRREREALEKRQQAAVRKLEATLARERNRYETALARWRDR